jgi:rod shape-determining protein MreD
MVRAALAQKRTIGQGPVPGARYVPAITVVLASLALAILPVVSTSGWFPDLGFVVLIAWRLLRSDAFPAWWAAPLGLANDLLSGSPVGLSVAVWTAAMLILDIADRRTEWRGYWLEWALAAILLFGNESAEWRVAQIMGASLPFRTVLPPLLISVLAFPVVAFFAARIDRWRLGR